jgi:hypothetical protein
MSKKIEINYYEAGQNYQQLSDNCQQQNRNATSSGISSNIMLLPIGFIFLIFISPIVLGGTRYIERPSQPSPDIIINNNNKMQR